MPKKQPVRPSAEPVSFHDAPSGKGQKYRDVIARAKAQKVPDRMGDMEGTPHFDDTQKSWESKRPTQTQLSPNTTAQLEAVAHATANAPVQEELPEEPEEPEPEEELTEDEKLRKAVESRITHEIDIGRYLMNGETTQRVPVIPGKLEITFRTVTDLEEAYVDAQLAQAKNSTARVFLRQSNEWALAFHISAINDVQWPSTMVQGEINESALQKRMGHIKKLSSPVFSLITQNLVWFLERVNVALTVEALGNG